ncbi:MAG: beta family protein [Methyloprofundus sp.]|nr:beta family protein [Methyloprofundus sp.]
MTESAFIYMPILKWRLGEYQALMRLNPNIKDAILPLIIVPPVEYDFEDQCPKKTVQEHISPFAERLNDKWGTGRVLIDFHDTLEENTVSDGVLVIDYVFDGLRLKSLNAVPVINILLSGNLYLNAVKRIVSMDKNGVAFRVKFNQLMSPGLDEAIQEIIKFLNLEYQCVDLVIDLEVPRSFEPYLDFAKALSHAINKISKLNDFRSFVVAGTSLNLSEIKKPGAEVVRHEWLLYKQLVNELALWRKPVFGDYAIEHPDFISLDMRFINPAGKIVYTTENTWLVPKGKSFRENRDQMISHCETIINSGHFCQKEYSAGDKRIYDTFHKLEGTGNQTTWKEVGVSHHLTLVVNQAAKFHAQ